MSAASHGSDRDCAGHVVDDECRVCRVHHGDPCDTCGGRGYHEAGCPEIDGDPVGDVDAFDRACAAYRRARSAARPRTVTVPVGAIAAAIADSVRAVLRAHGHDVRTMHGRIVHGQALDALLNEVGRNAAQCVVALADADEAP